MLTACQSLRTLEIWNDDYFGGAYIVCSGIRTSKALIIFTFFHRLFNADGQFSLFCP